MNSSCHILTSTTNPCGICSKAVKNSCKAIQCDNCETWIHSNCCGITNSYYENLIVQTNITFICPSCNVPSFIRNISSSVFETNHSFQVLEDVLNADDSSIPSPESFRPAPNATSTPKKTNRSPKHKNQKLTVLTVNCNSIRSLDKRSQLIALIDQHNPSVIFGQESKLCPDFKSCEVFPENYTVYRKDRS